MSEPRKEDSTFEELRDRLVPKNTFDMNADVYKKIEQRKQEHDKILLQLQEDLKPWYEYYDKVISDFGKALRVELLAKDCPHPKAIWNSHESCYICVQCNRPVVANGWAGPQGHIVPGEYAEGGDMVTIEQDIMIRKLVGVLLKEFAYLSPDTDICEHSFCC